MYVEFFGVRGSYPVASRRMMRYGGNTSCVYIKTCSEHIILDAGTGIRKLGNRLVKNSLNGNGNAHLFLTHTMWDHIQGIPFFKPLYIPGNQITIYSSIQNSTGLKDIISGQFDDIYFPVPLHKMSSQIEFAEISEKQTITISDCTVTTVRLNHPENTLGYRIECGGKTLTYMTDTAPFESILLGKNMEQEAQNNREKYIELRHWDLIEANKDADLMIFDTHFTAEGIKGKEHWGHSTWEYAAEVAALANVKALALFHHAPENDDETVDKIHQRIKWCEFPFKTIAAAEGLRFNLEDL